MKKRIALIVLLTIIAAIVDWVVIENWGSMRLFPWYHLSSWFIVAVVVFLLLKKRWLMSIGTVLIMSVAEDFLFLVGAWLIKGRPLYPLYCHDWLPLTWDWFGIPSSYFLSILLGVWLIFWGKYRTQQ